MHYTQIPTLTGKVAEQFEKIANSNLKIIGTIDMSLQHTEAKKILAKALINKKRNHF